MLAALSLTACTQAMDSAPALTPVLAKRASSINVIQQMPAQLAGFRRVGEITDYEATPRGAGLGASVNYQPAGVPGVATIYVYHGFVPPRALSPGLSSPDLNLQFRNAVGEIQALAPVRQYRITAVTDLPPTPGPDGQPALRCQRFLLAFERGSSDSYLCVGVADGRFLKLRVTLPLTPAGTGGTASAPGQGDREVAAFAVAAVAAVSQASGRGSAGI